MAIGGNMINFGKKIVKFRIPIIILSFLLLIPAVIGYVNTRVNYDILSYLPEEIDTMEGQEILKEEFGNGAFSMLMVEGMDTKDISSLKAKIEEVDGVSSVLWYDSILDISIPIELLPSEVTEAFNSGDTTLMLVVFSDTTSSDETIEAVTEIRKIANSQCFLAGMSSMVTDTKNLSEKEAPIYVVIAVILSAIMLALTMDSFVLPVIFLVCIGMAILYNLGSNVFFGEISYITKALAAVLQLGVTMDFSIFLWHSYKENQLRFYGDKERAMSHAIANTIQSIVGSSITTIAGFLSLCVMSFTLGLDLGIVMAKGVLIGVIATVTILPSFIMVFDGLIEKTTHKNLLPNQKRFSEFVIRHHAIFAIIFVILLIPAYYAQSHASVYYKLDTSLPDNLESVIASQKLDENFDMTTIHLVICSSDTSYKNMVAMCDELSETDGVTLAVSLDSLLDGVPEAMIPDDVVSILKNENYQLVLIASEYELASDEVNNQCEEIQEIISKYDDSAMLIGEAACTKDLIEITDTDFKMVSIVSIGVIFVIIVIVFKSVSLPILLVAAIEFAIFINMGIPYLTGTKLPFVASIVIGTIQLGSTVDYAILMTSRYKKERSRGKSKKEAVTIAHSTSMNSIIVSALSFFAATFGVGLYSDIDMISSLCMLMARGALISMAVVLLVVPSLFMIFDKVIVHTSVGFLPKKVKEAYHEKENRENSSDDSYVVPNHN